MRRISSTENAQPSRPRYRSDAILGRGAGGAFHVPLFVLPWSDTICRVAERQRRAIAIRIVSAGAMVWSFFAQIIFARSGDAIQIGRAVAAGIGASKW
jgi:hypothetical protein